MNDEKRRCLAVIRLRGSVGLDKEREYVFNLLRLPRKYHTVLLEASPSNLGSINKVKDYATWGDVDINTISLLLEKRGTLKGGKKLSQDYVKKELGYSSINGLAKAIYDLNVQVSGLSKLKPVFRLHPPKKGFSGSTKKPYPKGELGYRGNAINELIARMV